MQFSLYRSGELLLSAKKESLSVFGSGLKEFFLSDIFLVSKGTHFEFYFSDGVFVHSKAFFERLVSTLINIMYMRLAAAIVS